MAEAIKSPNSARPSALPAATPSEDAEANFLNTLTPTEMPAAGQQAAPTGSDPEANFLSSLDSSSPQGPPADSEFAPDPGFMQANIDQFSNLGDRVRAGLAANDTEKLGFLQQKYGPKNAVIRDGNIYFRKDPKDKLKRFDPASFELAADLLDFSREAVTEVPQSLAMIGGAMAGGPGGAVAGRTAMAPISNYIADLAAQSAGVPHDNSRNPYLEGAISSGLEAILPSVGGQILKRLPGTAAYEAAKAAGQKEVVALSAQSNEVAKAIQALEQQGLAAKVDGAAVGVPGANVSIPAHMLNPDNPKLKAIAGSLTSNPKYINAETKLAEDWGDALKNTLTDIGSRGNKGPLRPEELSSSVVNAVNDVQRAEGQAIGRYKNKAMLELKGQKLPLNDSTKQQAIEMLREFGFRPRQVEKQIIRKPLGAIPEGAMTTNLLPRGQVKTSQLSTAWRPPADLQSLVGKMGLTSTGEVRAVTNNLLELSKGLEGGMNIETMDRLRNSLGSAGSSLYGKQAGAKLSALSGEMRQTYRQAITAGLKDPIEQQGFNASMDDFGSIIKNVDTLKSALNSDASAKAIVKNIFTGKENLQKVLAIKKLSPESFGNLKAEFVDQLLTEFSSQSTKTGFKSGAMLDAIDKKYGKEFMRKVLDGGPGPNTETIRNILKVTSRIEGMTKGVSADTASEAQKRGVINVLIGLAADVKFKTLNGVTSLLGSQSGSDKALADILTRDGIDKYVASYPGKVDKALVKNKLTDFLAQHRIGQLLIDGTKAAGRGAVKAIDSAPVKAATKRGIIEQTQRGIRP